ncbi:MAG TPA: PhzF family phenazine biosynthesis protein [Anaerolineaceae bacterium]
MKIYQVDAFTSAPFAGNPAGVCVLEKPAPEDWMRAMAREMNLSETAFLVPVEDGYHLRWFTPKAEVRLCGHATLASAHILWEQGYLAPSAEARFQTLSGLLTASRAKDWIALNFPAQPPAQQEPAPGLLAALRLPDEPLYCGKNRADFLLELENEAAVRAVAPDFAALNAVENVRGVIVTSRGNLSGCDFVSRFFAPAVGVNEDPVTGSAHTALTPYWSAKLGKTELRARQVSERGGDLRLQNNGERVSILGQAVTVFRAELFAPPA